MDEDVADLGAVTVSDDNFVFVSEAGNDVADLTGDLFLGRSSDFAVFLESIATEGKNDTFLHSIIIPLVFKIFLVYNESIKEGHQNGFLW